MNFINQLIMVLYICTVNINICARLKQFKRHLFATRGFLTWSSKYSSPTTVSRDHQMTVWWCSKSTRHLYRPSSLLATREISREEEPREETRNVYLDPPGILGSRQCRAGLESSTLSYLEQTIINWWHQVSTLEHQSSTVSREERD